MTNIESERFNELYCELTENQKGIFKDVVIKLLKVNFLLRITNYDNYTFIVNNKELFSLFFNYMNFEFSIKEDKELAYIKTNDETLINRISKNETLCLLVLRLIYQEKLEEITLSNEIEVTVKELQDKLFGVRFAETYNDRVKKSTLNDMLKVFKQHNIIYYRDDLALDNTVIVIYPSIEVAMDFKKMDEIKNRLDMLKGGDDSETED